MAADEIAVGFGQGIMGGNIAHLFWLVKLAAVEWAEELVVGTRIG